MRSIILFCEIFLYTVLYSLIDSCNTYSIDALEQNTHHTHIFIWGNRMRVRTKKVIHQNDNIDYLRTMGLQVPFLSFILFITLKWIHNNIVSIITKEGSFL